ncbi:UNVERIFIED_CONTAM: hypothetical protein Sindi_2558900 [Sesamum indicum]
MVALNLNWQLLLSWWISRWTTKYFSQDRTLPRGYYNMKKLIKDLGSPVEKINTCKNGCMFYWKDNVDLEYCKFCVAARYKSIRGRDLSVLHRVPKYEDGQNGLNSCLQTKAQRVIDESKWTKGASTSWTQADQTDNEDEEDDEDNFENYETDDDEYEAT